MNLVIDFDNTIVNTDKAVWQIYREETGDLSTEYRNRSKWWYDEITPLWNREQQNKVFKNPQLFQILEFMPNAKEILQQLHREGHTITICTIHRHEGMNMKTQHIKEHIPFVDNIIIVDDGNKNGKSFIMGDLILDDSPKNLKESPCKYKLCFGDGLWNKQWTGHRVNNFDEFYDLVHKLENDILREKADIIYTNLKSKFKAQKEVILAETNGIDVDKLRSYYIHNLYGDDL